jgi:hypothetical protein
MALLATLAIEPPTFGVVIAAAFALYLASELTAGVDILGIE